jgi:hypothetical protein
MCGNKKKDKEKKGKKKSIAADLVRRERLTLCVPTASEAVAILGLSTVIYAAALSTRNRGF